MSIKVLMLGGSPYSTFVNLGVSLLSALTKQKGHEFKYFDLCDYDFSVKDEHAHGELQLEYKKVDDSSHVPKFKKRDRSQLVSDFIKTVEAYLPDLIGLSCTSGDFCFGKGLFDQLKRKYDIPVIVGGVHPTVDPEGVISEPWVDMVNIGQGEESFSELLDSFSEKGAGNFSIKNIWFKKDGDVIKNPLRDPLKSLDALPFPDWSIYNEYHFYRPFLGNLYRCGTIEISRGCPLRCTYCLNSYLPEIYGVHKYVTKTVERALNEIEFLKNKYDLGFIRFLDEIFLNKRTEYLEEFAEEYTKRINIPCIISTTATSVTKKKVELLKKMNCVNVGLGLETGNEELRRTVLKKPIPNKHYERAYALLNNAGIRTTAQIMFGLPYETIEDYKNAIRLVQKWNVDTAHVAIFYPFKGSKMREYAIEEGLLSDKKIFEFERDRFISTREIPTLLNFDSHQIKKMDYYRRFFTIYKETPEWLWPLVDECEFGENEFSEKLSGILRKLVSNKRFK